ncbi:MAG: LysR family transcriptional regulator [Pseudolabrys sp.]|nr:LysR family transcriptional regulator [Pseudolabrys sp.]
MLFELSQLKAFVTLTEELHFGRAAAKLNMTQPPLSRQIQLLEHALRVRLFERTSREVKLTPIGVQFLPEAKRILDLSESAIQTIGRIARGEVGNLTIGFTAAAGSSFLPILLTKSRSRIPELKFALKEMVSGEQTQGLASGRIDIGLLRPPIHSEFESMCVQRERLLAAFPLDHPLALGPVPTISDFDNLPFIMYSPLESRYFYELIQSIFKAHRVVPNYVQHITQIHSILSLVRSGIGVALVPETSSDLQFSGVSFRPIPMTPERPVELHLAWLKDNKNPALRQIVELVRSLSPDLLVSGLLPVFRTPG